MIILIIYLLGVIAAIYMGYCLLEKGESVSLAVCVFGFLSGFASWITFIVFFFMKYGDKIVFTKK